MSVLIPLALRAQDKHDSTDEILLTSPEMLSVKDQAADTFHSRCTPIQ